MFKLERCRKSGIRDEKLKKANEGGGQSSKKSETYGWEVSTNGEKKTKQMILDINGENQSVGYLELLSYCFDQTLGWEWGKAPPWWGEWRLCANCTCYIFLKLALIVIRLKPWTAGYKFKSWSFVMKTHFCIVFLFWWHSFEIILTFIWNYFKSTSF